MKISFTSPIPIIILPTMSKIGLPLAKKGVIMVNMATGNIPQAIVNLGPNLSLRYPEGICMTV